jgi:hypothetical protein
MKKLIFCCALALFSISLQAQWVRTNGPIGGNITAMTIKDDMILVAAEQGVYRSADKGLTWTIADASIKGGKGFCFIQDKVFLIGNFALYFSSDKGVSWKDISSSFPAGSDPRSIASIGNLVLVGTYGGLFSSADFGSSWKVAMSGIPQSIISHIRNEAGKLYAFAFETGVYTSVDSARTWQIKGYAPMDFYVRESWINGNEIIASAETGWGASTGGVIRSINGGGSWQTLSNIQGNAYSIAGIMDTVVVATDQGLYVSKNQGLTWEEKSAVQGLKHLTVCSGDNVVLTGTTQGVFISRDQLGSWALVPDIFSTSVFSLCSTSSHLWAGAYEYLWNTDNSGNTWNSPMNITQYGSDLFNTIIESGGFLFASTQFAGMFRSKDNGVTWTPCNNGLNTNGPVGEMVTVGSSIFTKSAQKVYRSLDKGDSWAPASNGITSGKLWTLHAEGSVLLAGMNTYGSQTPVLYKSVDITDMASGPNGIYAIAHNSIWSGTSVYFSSDYGNTWKDLNVTGYPQFIKSAGSVIFLGTNGGLLYSMNGTNWNTENTGFLTATLINSLETWHDTLFAATR